VGEQDSRSFFQSVPIIFRKGQEENYLSRVPYVASRSESPLLWKSLKKQTKEQILKRAQLRLELKAG
jgi:hypothetical protein